MVGRAAAILVKVLVAMRVMICGRDVFLFKSRFVSEIEHSYSDFISRHCWRRDLVKQQF